MKKAIINSIFIFVCITNAIAQLPSYIPANGLVGYWPFSGNANDESGNNNNGTVNGAILTNDRASNNNKAYSFDGVNDQINVNHSSQISPNQFVSINTWIYPRAYENNKHIISKGSHVNLYYRSYGIIGPETDNKIKFFICNGSSEQYLASTANLILNQWAMITSIYDGISMKIFINGVLDSQVAFTGNINQNTEPLVFGSHIFYSPSDYWLDGKIDDIGIWNRVLTASEITALYQSQNCNLSVSSTQNNVTINGGNNGSASVNVSGGTAPYTYSWSPSGGASSNATGLTAGSYTCNITDANSCSTSTVVTITQPAPTSNCLPAYLPTNGLVAWYPFCGNANDESGNGHNGIVNGATTTSDRFGNAGKAYYFGSAGSNYIQLPEVSTAIGSPNSSYSCVMWFKNTPNQNQNIILHCSETGAQTISCQCTNYSIANVRIINPDKMKIYHRNPNSNNEPSSVNSIIQNQWNNIIITINGQTGNYSLYLNGVLEPSMSFTFSPNENYYISNRTWQIGAFSNFPAQQFVGEIDDIGIWNRTLTACEINQLYTSGTSTITTLNTSSTICAGSTSTLTANGATSYTWMPGNFTGTSLTVSPSVTTTYTVTGTNANGCSNTATVNVNVNALPIVTAASSAAAVCAGNSVTLSGGGASTYVWSTGVTNAVSFVPTTNTTYTVTGSNANGCSNTATTSVVVNALPIVTAASSASAVCAGNSVTLSGGGASSYVWSSGVTNAVSFIPTNSETYTLTGTDANGCSNTATTSVVINSLPIVTAVSSASAVCGSNGVTLSGGGASTYVWSNGVTNAISFIPTNSATYTVTGTDVNGCVNTATTSVAVNTLPVVTAASSASAVCAGSSVTLSGGGASTYIWSNGVTDAVNFVPTNSATYTVTGTDGNGCLNTATTSVAVNTLPVVTATSSASAVCAGNSITLSGGGALNYVWSNGVTNAISFVPTNSATYTVTGTDANGCSNTATTSLVVNVLPTILVLASSQVYCPTDLAGTLSANPTGGLWSGNGVTGNSFDPLLSGFGLHNAVYSYTDANSCVNSDTLIMSVNLCTGVNEITAENLFTVYPNPVSTEINIKANISFIGSVYTIYDATGKLVLTGKINSENTLIELGNFSAGIYLLNVGDKTTRTFKVVKE